MSAASFIGRQLIQQHVRTDQFTEDWRPPNVASSAYVFQSESLPEDRRLYATVSNGHLGAVVYGDRMFLNGVYSGRGNKSRRAAIPLWHSISVSYVSPPMFCNHAYSLDTVRATFSHDIVSDGYHVTHRTYAHRSLPCLLVNEIDITRLDDGCADGEIAVCVDSSSSFAPPDIKFDKIKSGIPGVTLMSGMTNTAEAERSYRLPVYCYYTDVPTMLILPDNLKRAKWTFILSIAVNKHEALMAYRAGEELVCNGDILHKDHIQAWANIWQAGRVDVFGDERLARVIYGCLYYIMSSLPMREPRGVSFFGLSPESLAYGDGTCEDYMGHVFWDQETWMFPPVLLLHADVARILLGTRMRVMAQAAANARASGDQGLRFPWEQGFTGMPTSPSEACEKYQVHINGDISLALEQYVYATGDARFFKEARGLELVEGLAQFWLGRLVLEKDTGLYGIHDVMPPDEYHWPVNNSAYTNEVAKKSITLLSRIRQQLGLHNVTEHQAAFSISDKIYVPFDTEHNYIPEFDHYDYTQAKWQTGVTVKQADVILLHYPLMVALPEDVHRNNLRIYESVTSSSGPAMTWSMFAIGHLQLRNGQKAAELFARQYAHVQEPFQIWCEEPLGRGAVNFITGMGGLLQAVLFGYSGVRILSDRLLLDPQLPLSVHKMCITGIDYRGASIDITIEEKTMTITKTSSGPPELVLCSYNDVATECLSLCVNVPITAMRNRRAIAVQ